MKRQELEIIYVNAFYDIPLSGLCLYNGKIERFNVDYDTEEATIIYLTSWQRFKELYRKKLFEICVGTHQSYVKNKKPNYFYWRKPKILHKLLYTLYFKSMPWKWLRKNKD